MSPPMLSLVVLAWNGLELTKTCVESLQRHTGPEFELIIVDNGSQDGTASYAIEAADVGVVNESNLGFAAGMNAGLAKATGDYVAFINNDTRFPARWADHVLETFENHPSAGIVLPAVTKAGNPVSVRDTPGGSVVRLIPFGEFPSGVVYVMPRSIADGLGGWNEAYAKASAEDLDLAFTVWAHGLEVLLDERVLIEHESQASVRHLPNRKQVYRDNLEQFLKSWEDPTSHRRLLSTVDAEAFEANLERAQTAVIWIRRMLETRHKANELRREVEELSAERKPVRRWFRSRS